MHLSNLIVPLLLLVGDPSRRPQRGGFYERNGCERLEGWIELRPFEEFTGDSVRESMEFDCAVALYLDLPDVTHEQKFEHLSLQAAKDEKWAVALTPLMAELDWSKFIERVRKRSAKLFLSEWFEVCGEVGIRTSKSRPVGAAPPPPPPPSWMMELFFEQALHSSSESVRICMMSLINDSRLAKLSIKHALAFAARLPVEEDSSVRREILMAQLWFNDPRTNKVVRDFLRGPPEFSVLGELCNGRRNAPFVARGRYDFLPDLKALRARLPLEIAAEKAIRKRSQTKPGIEKAMRLLDEVIPALEEKKAQDEEAAKRKGDAGIPTEKPRGATK